MADNNRQGTVGDQGQIPNTGNDRGGNPKRNTGSVQHERRSGAGENRDQGMPKSSGRSQSEMGRSDDDD